MISVLTNHGALAFQVFSGRFVTTVFIEFLERLLKHAGQRKVVLIVDGHPVHKVHKANAVAEVSQFLREFGYAGFFILDGKPLPLSQFDKNRHQDGKNIGTHVDGYRRKGVYINNFIFLPESAAEQYLKDIEFVPLG